MMYTRFVRFAVLIPSLMVACSTPTSAPTEIPPPIAATQPPAVSSGPTDAPTQTAPESASTLAPTVPPDLPAWMSMPLTDVRTGATFTLADNPGRVTILEAMAVWCTNCRVQQKVIADRLPVWGENVVVVSLDVDLNETPELLAAYSEKQGFNWAFAVATTELAQMLATEYGNGILSPPSVPMLFIDSNLQPHLAEFGHKTAEALDSLVAEHLR